MSSWWSPIDVSTWREHVREQRGKRPKRWIVDPSGDLWLRKAPPDRDPMRPHTARLSEPAIEAFAIELARRVGIDCADTRPATWGEQRGVVSRLFHGPNETQHPGAELLGLPSESGSGLEAKERKDEGRARATISSVIAMLESFEKALGAELVVELVRPFARILAFDAWVGNGDRHAGNWALIVRPGTNSQKGGVRLAPMYDPAACFGVELTDDNTLLRDPNDAAVVRYAERCGSGFGGGRVRERWVTGIRMSDVLAAIVEWPPWKDAISELRPRFLAVTDEAEQILSEIPTEWLSQERKRFAVRLVAHRVRII